MGKKSLFSDDGKEALQYLRDVKKLDDKTINQFDLGYFPGYVKNLYGDRHEFASRLVIPVYNQYNDLLVISSRDWREDAYQKFLHEQFDKKFYLYALNVAKPSILKYSKAVLVEGEFDVITSHQYGITCTVGVLGSAPQLNQIAILARYCREMYVIFDGDPAGAAATEKLMKLSRDFQLRDIYGITIIPVNLPEKVDPDDLLRDSGKAAFIELMKQSKENSEWLK